MRTTGEALESGTAVAERIAPPTFEEAQRRGLEPRCLSDRRPPRLLLLRVETWLMRFWSEARTEGDPLYPPDPLYAAVCWLSAHQITHLRIGTEHCAICDTLAPKRGTDG